MRDKLYFEKTQSINIETKAFLNDITLSFFHNSSNDLIQSCSLLFLLTKKKPVILYKTLSKKKHLKREVVGCQVKLYKGEAFIFFLLLVIKVIPSIKLLTLRDIKTNSFLLTINDLSLFSEIKPEFSRYYCLKNLKIYLNFNKSFNFNIHSYLKLSTFFYN